MLRWVWVFVAVVLSSGIYFSIRYGLRPKPIPMMKPTVFADYEEMGSMLFKRLSQPIRSEKIIVLGYEPTLSEANLIWQGLLKAARSHRVQINKIYYLGSENLPGYFQSLKVEDLDLSQIESIKEQLIRAKRRNGINVFIVPTDQATHLRKDSLTKKLESSALGPVLSLSQLPLILDSEEQEKVSSSCTELDPDDFRAKLDCTSFKFAKSQARRKLDPSKTYGALERHGLKEYLIFVHPVGGPVDQ